MAAWDSWRRVVRRFKGSPIVVCPGLLRLSIMASASNSLAAQKGSAMRLFEELYRLVARIADREQGQTMAEYAVVLAVITVVIVAALTTLAGGIGSALGAVTAVLP